MCIFRKYNSVDSAPIHGLGHNLSGYLEYGHWINVLTQLVLFFYENNFVIVISGHFKIPQNNLAVQQILLNGKVYLYPTFATLEKQRGRRKLLISVGISQFLEIYLKSRQKFLTLTCVTVVEIKGRSFQFQFTRNSFLEKCSLDRIPVS